LESSLDWFSTHCGHLGRTTRTKTHTRALELESLGELERNVNFDSKVAHRALQLRLAKQQLACTKVAGLFMQK